MDVLREYGYKPIDGHKRKEHHQDTLQNYKLRKGCMDCGYKRCAEALEFDHRPEEVKLFNLSDCRNRPWKSVWAELQKCDVVCANCHRERTVRRREIGL